jgi:hypothetical protein
MMTPENDQEKFALKMISPTENMELAVKPGTFHSANGSDVPAGYKTSLCQGGYLRTWTNEDSIMILLTPKKLKKVFKAIRRKSLANTFNEEVALYDDKGNEIFVSSQTHPESYFSFEHEGIEYFSQPYSNSEKPVYSRVIENSKTN